MMSLDEQLAELLAPLGVVLETYVSQESDAFASAADTQTHGGACPSCSLAASAPGASPASADSTALDEEASALSEISLFQTSREHYGVFYRLDLSANAPQLRIFTPDEENAFKMRCYLVRPSEMSPMRAWFYTTRTHSGSAAYDESRETTEQHLLFAAGETLKRLFWAGEQDSMRFPAEITVSRLA